MKTFSITIVLTFILSINIFSQKKNFLGEKLPNSPIEILLQAPTSSIDSWSDLEGKWLLLEFWTTWCAPCIAKMPVLNKIQKEMSDENIQFISLSPEKPEIVKRFLKRKSISGWVGIDSDRSFLEALNITSYPTTILVNPQGQIHSYLDVKSLDTNTLLKAMTTPVNNKKNTVAKRENPSEKIVSLKANTKKNVITADKSLTKKVISIGGSHTETTTNDKKLPKPIYSVSIEKTDAVVGYKMSSIAKGKLISTHISLSELLSFAYDISPALMFGDQTLLNSKYEVRIVLPEGEKALFEKTLQAAIKKKLELTIEKETREVTAYELYAPKGISKNLYASSGEKTRRASSDKGVIAATNFNIKFLIRNLEELLKAKVYDKTNLAEEYDYNLYWEANNPDTLVKALQKQLGLVLKKRVIKSEVLVIEEKSK